MAKRIDIERGERMRAVRLERREEQGPFAGHLNAAAEKLQLPVRYTYTEVSRRETGRKALDAEDFATVALLDPQKRGWAWVAFGTSIRVGKDAYDLLAGQIRRPKAG